MAFIYDLTDTWNAGGTTFNAIKMNVTDSASAAASRLISLQVGGSERFSVDKAGIGTFASVIRAAGGSTSAPAFSFGSDTNTGMWSPSSDAIAFSTAGSERLRVDSSGRVGIGTDAPSDLLHVAGNIRAAGASPVIAIWNAAGSDRYGFLFGQSGSMTFAAEGASRPMLFSVAGSERMRITSAGNVGIGTSSPSAKLVVSEAGTGFVSFAPANASDALVMRLGYATDFSQITADSFGGNLLIGADESNTKANSFIAFRTDATERARIDSAGNLGLGVVPGANDFTGVLQTRWVGHGITPRSATNLVFNMNANHNGGGWRYGNNGAAALYVQSDAGHVWATAPSGTAGNAITFTQAMTLTPAAELILDSGSGGGRLTFVPGNAINSFLSTTTGFGAYNPTRVIASDIRFETGSSPSERMRIDSSGNVGIGTTNPAGWRLKLDKADAQHLNMFNTAGNGVRINMADQSWQAEIEQNAGNLLFKTGGTTERMRIDSSGNVGIGTSSPEANGRLTLDRAGSNYLMLRSGGTNRMSLYVDSGISVVDAQANPLAFNAGSAERMRIDSSGNLLVGTTSPQVTATDDAIVLRVEGGSETFLGVRHDTGAVNGNYFAGFSYNGTVIGSISQSGTTGVSYVTTSDARLKENVAPADDAAALIDAIQVRKFDWKADGSHQRYGMVAQELLEVAPEAVSVPADEDQMMGVDYSKLVPMLIKEVQSLRARVAQLEGN